MTHDFLEFHRENELLSEWAVWARKERMVTGYGAGVLRKRDDGVTPQPDDLMMPVDRAVAMTGQRYKRMLVRWYLANIYDDQREMRAALDAFRTCYTELTLEQQSCDMRTRAIA